MLESHLFLVSYYIISCIYVCVYFCVLIVLLNFNSILGPVVSMLIQISMYVPFRALYLQMAK